MPAWIDTIIRDLYTISLTVSSLAVLIMQIINFRRSKKTLRKVRELSDLHKTEPETPIMFYPSDFGTD